MDIIPPIGSKQDTLSQQPNFKNEAKFATHIQTSVAFNSTIRLETSRERKIKRQKTREQAIISRVRLSNNNSRDLNKDSTTSSSSSSDSDSDTYT